jgi:hexosaminidase
VKLNVFHWHLSDDQGFRVESKVFPKLHQLGSDGNFYTQDEVRHTIAYAAERGIRVIPEFDMPGHTTSWFVGYPELASAPGPYRIERRWGILEPTLDPSREEVYAFLDKLIGEMSALFPDEYFHIGGDEVLEKQWKENPAIRAFCAKNGWTTSQELHAYFNRRLQTLVKKHGKKMMGWDEVLQPGLSHDLVIQSWRGAASLAEAARKGYRGILSFGYYLDRLDTAAFSYRIDPSAGDSQALTGEQAQSILGGEACMWTEYADHETVDSRIWPRLAAIAERLWSPAKVADVDSMYRRLAVIGRWLDWTGLEHRSNYSRMMERLSGGKSIADLRVLADAVEAEGIMVRQDSRHYSSQTPLNRLVDTALPESEQIRLLETAVNRFVDSPSPQAADRNYIRLVFEQWRDNHTALLPCLTGNFLLREGIPLSEDLSRLGAAGLQALEYVESGTKAPADWLRGNEELLQRAEHPRAEVVLAAGRPVRILVEMAGRGQTHGAARKSSDNPVKTGTFDDVSNGSITRRQLF